MRGRWPRAEDGEQVTQGPGAEGGVRRHAECFRQPVRRLLFDHWGCGEVQRDLTVRTGPCGEDTLRVSNRMIPRSPVQVMIA